MVRNTLNTTELATGKDGYLLVECLVNGAKKNVILAEIENFTVNMNVNATEKQPVGSILVYSIPTGVTFALVFSEMVVRDDVIMEPMLDSIRDGKVPVFHFQGVVEKPDGQEQRMAFNNAVPNGTFDLMKVTPGEVISRDMNFALNSIPEYISRLASTYLTK